MVSFILDKLGYIPKSKLNQSNSGTLRKRVLEQDEINDFVVTGKNIEDAPWACEWLNAQQEYLLYLADLIGERGVIEESRSRLNGKLVKDCPHKVK